MSEQVLGQHGFITSHRTIWFHHSPCYICESDTGLHKDFSINRQDTDDNCWLDVWDQSPNFIYKVSDVVLSILHLHPAMATISQVSFLMVPDPEHTRTIIPIYPSLILKSLFWWLGVSRCSESHKISEQERIVRTTDASPKGWGVHSGNQFIQGSWMDKEVWHNIDWLELRGIRFYLMGPSTQVSNRIVLVMWDNTAK